MQKKPASVPVMAELIPDVVELDGPLAVRHSSFPDYSRDETETNFLGTGARVSPYDFWSSRNFRSHLPELGLRGAVPLAHGPHSNCAPESQV
jgi:hypothetical protein